ncbi:MULTISPECIES: hypothetical protein [Acidaminococcus]|jgi:hypothetical protein|uniref:hypothetical protein n=1 Tax=Acidaminococcus TaxID=904 RepID=UPI002A75E057|nr:MULTISPECIES: hypothetical protein [Acidaminococcus]MDY2739734.1 hypothetical protein [Acidaminococcus sp.]
MRKEYVELAWQHLVAEARFFEDEIMPAYSKAVKEHICDLVTREALIPKEDEQ